jgi:hypothetical protein
MRIFSISKRSWLQRKVTALSVRLLSPKQVFNRIYRQREWTSKESVSGPGSEVSATEALVDQLPDLLRTLSIKSICDIPCGDFNWMRRIDLTGVDYIGGDIVPEIVHENSRSFGGPGVRFEVMDLLASRLPSADLVLCRDCLGHFSYRHILRAIENIRKSGSRYLATTFYPFVRSNKDIPTGYWRALNLTMPPFRFPDPSSVIIEMATELGPKGLGIWRISELSEK